MTSNMLTSAEELCPPSFIEAAAICECSSIIPGVKCLPLASITFAPDAFKFFPIASIFPSLTIRSVSYKIPSCSFVQMVAFLINKISDSGSLSKPNALLG